MEFSQRVKLREMFDRQMSRRDLAVLDLETQSTMQMVERREFEIADKFKDRARKAVETYLLKQGKVR